MPENPLDGAVEAIGELALTILPFLQLAAGAGIAAMAIVQLLKEALYLRAIYNRFRTRRWFRNQWGDTSHAAYEQLVGAVGGGSEFSLFGLSSLDLSQQLKSGAQIAIADPVNHESLLVALTNQAVADRLKNSSAGNRLNSPEGQLALTLSNRKIDALQASLGHWWKFSIRLTAIALSAGLILYGFTQVDGEWDPLAYALIALVGGIVAPVAKDVISAIESLKKPGSTGP